MEDNNFDKNKENEEKKEEATYAFRWSYAEQDEANAAARRKKQRNGVLIYAIIVTAAFLLCFALLVGVILADRAAEPPRVERPDGVGDVTEKDENDTPYDTGENIIPDTRAEDSEDTTPAAPTEKKAVIGIKGGAVSQMNGYPVAGIYVSEIIEGYDAGNHLVVGDIIVGINNGEVLAIEDISEVITTMKEGDTVVLKIYRSGMLFDVKVILGVEK